MPKKKKKTEIVKIVVEPRADWYRDDPILPHIPHYEPIKDRPGVCKFFANATAIGKFRNEDEGPYCHKGRCMLPCIHLNSFTRCQNLDQYGVCPIKPIREG